MELQVARNTISRVEKQYQEKEFITWRELPDLDCKYIGDHLSNQIFVMGENIVNFKSISLKVIECFGVLYNNGTYTEHTLLNRLKKMKI